MNQENEKIINFIKDFEKVVIHRHENPDPDALGSQIGLKDMIQQSFPEKQVKVVGEEVESLKFIGEMDEVEDDFYEGALVFVLDTANTDRISDKRYKNGKWIIKIDHHPGEDHYGNYNVINVKRTSVSEMITEIFEDGSNEKDLYLSDNGAQALYAGIVGDTGRFKYDKVTSKTFYHAGILLDCGADPQKLYKELYKEPVAMAKLKGVVLSDFVQGDGVAHYVMYTEEYEKLGMDRREAANVVNVMADIEGNDVWVLFIQDEDGKFRTRIRSKETPINHVAQLFGGGGHPLASGASVEDQSELRLMIDVLKKVVRDNK